MCKALLLFFFITFVFSEVAMAKVDWRSNNWKTEDERRWGLYDSDSYSWVTPCIYDYYLSIIDGVTTARLGDKWGVLNTKGEVVIPFVYDYLFYFSNSERQKDSKEGISAAKLNGKWGFINLGNEQVIPLIYDEMQTSELNNQGDFIIVKLNGKFGVINRKGETLVPFDYDNMGFEQCKTLRAFGARKGAEWLTLVLEPNGPRREYSDTDGFHHFSREDKALLWAVDVESGLVTMLRPDGSRLIPPGYEPTHPSLMPDFKDGMARVRKDGRYGFINETGQLVISPRYQLALEKRGQAVIEYFAEPELAVSPHFGMPPRFHLPLIDQPDDTAVSSDVPQIPVEKLPQMGISPSQVAEINYRAAWEKKYGKNGCKTDGVGEFYGGLALVGINGLYGYIGKDGSYAIEPQYPEATAFHPYERKGKSTWVAAVRKDKKWGLIGPDGKALGRFKFDSAYQALESIRL